MGLTHFDENGNARMVDVSDKNITKRFAIAEGEIIVSKEVYLAIKDKKVEKGDVLAVATTAGIMGVKKNYELIPMCHILNISNAKIEWELNDKEIDGKHSIKCICTVKCEGKTGVEMEALTGVSIALLTVYDMCKAIDKTMKINNIYLKEKNGGKSGHILNKILLVLLLVFCLSKNVFAIGPGDIIDTNKKIAVIGDSYAQYLFSYLNPTNMESYLFPVLCIDNDINHVIATNAILTGNNIFIVFSTGVNDYLLDTDIGVFEQYLREYIELAAKQNKRMIFHTYMKFPNMLIHNNKSSIDDYDNLIKRLTSEYDNAYYIDMSNFNDFKFNISDGMHFNKEFYDTLYDKIMNLVENINLTD